VLVVGAELRVPELVTDGGPAADDVGEAEVLLLLLLLLPLALPDAVRDELELEEGPGVDDPDGVALPEALVVSLGLGLTLALTLVLGVGVSDGEVLVLGLLLTDPLRLSDTVLEGDSLGEGVSAW
jgi:hypothetical protein